MKDYEVGLVVHPSRDEAGVAETVESVSQVIRDHGGDVIKVDQWGRRQLAYAVNKQREGTYLFLEVQLPPEAVIEIDRNLKLSEDILRFLILKAEPSAH